MRQAGVRSGLAMGLRLDRRRVVVGSAVPVGESEWQPGFAELDGQVSRVDSEETTRGSAMRASTYPGLQGSRKCLAAPCWIGSVAALFSGMRYLRVASTDVGMVVSRVCAPGDGEQRGGWQARVGLQRGKRERACFSVQVSAAVRMRSSLQLNSHGIYLHLDFICTLVSSTLSLRIESKCYDIS